MENTKQLQGHITDTYIQIIQPASKCCLEFGQHKENSYLLDIRNDKVYNHYVLEPRFELRNKLEWLVM